MLIKKLQVKRFRNIAGTLELNFAPGITLIKAANEGGKSTVRKAIDFALYGDPKSSKRELKDLKSWNAGDMYEINLEFTAGGQKFMLVRDFSRQVSALINQQTGSKLSDKREIARLLAAYTGLPTAALFRNTACFSAEELSQVKDAKELTSRLEEKISGVEGVAVEDLLKKIQARLTGLNKGLTRHAISPGPIRDFQDRLENLQKEYREMEKEINDGMEDYIRFNGLAGKIEKTARVLDIKKKTFEKYSAYKRANDDYIKARERFNYFHDSLEERKKLGLEFEKLKKEVEKIKIRGLAVRKALDLMQPVLDDVDVINAARKEILSMREKIKKINAAAGDLASAQARLEGLVKIEDADLKQGRRLKNELASLRLAGANQGFKIDIKPLAAVEPEIVVDGLPQIWTPGAPVDVAAGAVIIFPGVAEMRLENKNTQAAGNIEAEKSKKQELGAILKKYGADSFEELQKLKELYIKAWQGTEMKKVALHTLLGDGKKAGDYESDLAIKEEAISMRQEKIKAALPGIEKAITEIEFAPGTSGPSLDKGLSLNEPGILQEKAKDYQELRDRLADRYNEVNNPCQRLLGQLNKIPPAGELEDGKKEWAANLYITKTALEQMEMPGADMEQIVRLEEEIKEKDAELAGYEKDKDRLEIKINMQKYGVEDLENLQDQIDQTRETLEYYQEKARVLLKVKELFEEARRHSLAQMAASIGERMEDYVQQLTAGRYQKVEISPGGMDIQIYSSEKDGYVDIDQELSTGTRDQIYLAARLAMIPAAANGRRPPLLLDDSLVYFDPGRREKAFAVIKNLAREHQVLIFSCHDYYDDLASNVIELGD